MRTVRYIGILSVGLMLFSCEAESGTKLQDAPNGPDIRQGKDFESLYLEESTDESASARKLVNAVGYSVSLVRALDFLDRKGERVAEEDKADLSREAALILETELKEGHRDIFDSPRMTLSKDDAIQYLVGKISEDVMIYQDTKEFKPTGVSYEGALGNKNKMRVILFFRDLDLNKKMRVSYYDRLLGSGIINFGVNNNLDI